MSNKTRERRIQLAIEKARNAFTSPVPPGGTPASRDAVPLIVETPDSDPERDDDGTFVKPPARRVFELPVNPIADFVQVPQVKAAIMDMDAGRFFRAAQLVDVMYQDDRIGPTLDKRIGGLLGLPLTFEPAKGQLEQRSEGLIDELREVWPQRLQEADLSALMRWGIMLGAGVASIEWDAAKAGPYRWLPHLKVWHPQFLIWRWDTRSFWVQTLAGLEEVRHGDGRWILYAPYGVSRGWIRGRVRSLAVSFMVRRFCTRDWAQYSEIHGTPIRKAIVPVEADEKESKKFVRDLADLANNCVVKVEQGEEGNRYDVELIEAMSQGYESFEKLLSKAEANIAIALVGQNLTSEVKQGSRAAATVHENVEASIVRADGETLVTTLRTGLVEPWAEFNHGDRMLAPWPKYATEPPPDLKTEADALAQLATALVALRNAGEGVAEAVNARAILERWKVPLVDGAADEIPMEAKAEPDPNAPPAGGLPGQKPPPKKLSAWQRGALLAARKPTGGLPRREFVDGQVYADAVADGAQGKAPATVRPYLDKVIEAVHAAQSYEALRHSLQAIFLNADPDTLRDLVRDCVVLANLNGRDSAQQETP